MNSPQHSSLTASNDGRETDAGSVEKSDANVQVSTVEQLSQPLSSAEEMTTFVTAENQSSDSQEKQAETAAKPLPSGDNAVCVGAKVEQPDDKVHQLEPSSSGDKTTTVVTAEHQSADLEVKQSETTKPLLSSGDNATCLAKVEQTDDKVEPVADPKSSGDKTTTTTVVNDGDGETDRILTVHGPLSLGRLLDLGEDCEEDIEDMQEESDAVCGPCSNRDCSYERGYEKRQAVFSCLTCTPESGGEPAGVCLACALKCHEGHKIEEIYTKRHFRCDCGNSKFTAFACKLTPRREAINEENRYNHNFWGRYCVCKRPCIRSDPDVAEQNLGPEWTEHQCFLCEDWFHRKCCELGERAIDELDSLVCAACSEKFPFVAVYARGAKLAVASENAPDWWLTNVVQQCLVGEEASCYLVTLKSLVPADADLSSGKAFFTRENEIRRNLCHCTRCMMMYRDLACLYLLDPADSYQTYLLAGRVAKRKREADMERMSVGDCINAIGDENGLDHSARIYVADAVRDLNEKMAEFLQEKSKDDQGADRVITRADINEFFEMMRTKRSRPDIPPPNCTDGHPNI